jgi:hypothetical protein
VRVSGRRQADVSRVGDSFGVNSTAVRSIGLPHYGSEGDTIVSTLTLTDRDEPPCALPHTVRCR